VTQRGADWWDRNFARRDDFHASPYEQLTGAFAAVGERDAADEIHYDEQARADESSKYPPAKPGALGLEPLKAAASSLTRLFEGRPLKRAAGGDANAAPSCGVA